MNSEEKNLRGQRLQKLKDLEKNGIALYPETFEREHFSRDLLDGFEPDGKDQERQTRYRIAGRVKAKNMMGKAGFYRVEDSAGMIQVYAARDDLNEKQENGFKIFKGLDIGDLVGLEGGLFATQTGETTLWVDRIELLAKCVRPLPVVKRKGDQVYDSFEDKEQRYRRRYVDMIVNPEVRQDFINRSRIINEIRNFLTGRGFLEVETPMLVPIPSGAAARPFVTHHNALNIPLYMRIAPELYLKRLLVGGLDKVFELNRNFRNEGISRKHNPEFTMLEIYQAFANMDTMLELTEELITHTAESVLGTLKLEYQGQPVDLTPPWKRQTYVEIIQEHSGIDFGQEGDLDHFKKLAKEKGVDADECQTVWQVSEFVFDDLVEDKLIQPVFVTDYPQELSPLAKAHPDKPGFVRRFEPYIVGREMGNAFSELNDPQDQLARFQEQAKKRDAGDEEAMPVDADYIDALESGMPPAGGLGIGIDRLIMLLLDKASIKDTILFPLLRPEGEGG